MNFVDYLPGIIVLGYALMGALIWAGTKVRVKLPMDPEDATADEAPVPPPPAGAAPVPPFPTSTMPVTPAAEEPILGKIDVRANRLRFWARALIWAAVVVGVGTTVTWLVAALDPSEILELLLWVVAVVLFGLIFAFAMTTESLAKKFVWGGFTLILAADFWFFTLSPLLYLVGLVRTVDFHVTASFVTTASNRSASGSSTVQGDYLLDGAMHHADFWSVGWGPMPAEGESIRVGVSPVWPTQIIESTQAAWIMIAFGVGIPLLIGGILLGSVTFAERRKARIAREPVPTDSSR